MKHFAMLPKAGQIVVALLLMLIERYWDWPQQVKFALAALIPKATQGYRSIGVMPAIYIVWAKQRGLLPELGRSRMQLPTWCGHQETPAQRRLGGNVSESRQGCRTRWRRPASCGIGRTTMRMLTGRSW